MKRSQCVGLSVQHGGKEISAPTGADEAVFHGLVITCSHFYDESAGELMLVELICDPRPIDAAFAGNEMGIPVSKVVADVHHLEMAGKFLEHAVQIMTQVRVPGVETCADGAAFDFSEQEQHVADISEEKMRQHVLQKQVYANLAAKCGHAFERKCGVLNTQKKLFPRRTAGTLRARV